MYWLLFTVANALKTYAESRRSHALLRRIWLTDNTDDSSSSFDSLVLPTRHPTAVKSSTSVYDSTVITDSPTTVLTAARTAFTDIGNATPMKVVQLKSALDLMSCADLNDSCAIAALTPVARRVVIDEQRTYVNEATRRTSNKDIFHAQEGALMLTMSTTGGLYGKSADVDVVGAKVNAYRIDEAGGFSLCAVRETNASFRDMLAVEASRLLLTLILPALKKLYWAPTYANTVDSSASSCAVRLLAQVLTELAAGARFDHSDAANKTESRTILRRLAELREACVTTAVLCGARQVAEIHEAVVNAALLMQWRPVVRRVDADSAAASTVPTVSTTDVVASTDSVSCWDSSMSGMVRGCTGAVAETLVLEPTTVRKSGDVIRLSDVAFVPCVEVNAVTTM